MALMSPIYVLFALDEPYNLNRNYDLIWQLNKGGGGIRDYTSWMELVKRSHLKKGIIRTRPACRLLDS